MADPSSQKSPTDALVARKLNQQKSRHTSRGENQPPSSGSEPHVNVQPTHPPDSSTAQENGLLHFTEGEPDYSDLVPRNSREALLLKRIWESLHRDKEFRRDCQWLKFTCTTAERKKREWEFKGKWGYPYQNPDHSFDSIVGKEDPISRDEVFGYLLHRVEGQRVTGPDTLVHCQEFEDSLEKLAHTMHALISKSKGSVNPDRHTFRDKHSMMLHTHVPPFPQQVHLSMDVDANPIAVLAKVLMILRLAREARVTWRAATPYAHPNHL